MSRTPPRWSARHATEIRFVVSFLVIAGALFAVYSFPYAEGSFGHRASDGYLRMYAHLAGAALSVVEPHVVVSGQEILGRYGLRIVRGCDAVDAQILLVSALLASHTFSWRWRLTGALAGFLLITVANVARIGTLYFVGAYWPSYFDFFHHELWPLLLILLAAGAFVGWARAAKGRGEERHALASA